MGLQQDQGMKGIEFSLIAIASLPASLWLKSRKDTFYRGSRWQWFGWLIFPAGVSVACMAAAQNYGQILAMRILLGCCEAAISPALGIITSTWYTKAERLLAMAG